MYGLARTLARAHALSIVHRNLKASKVRVRPVVAAAECGDAVYTRRRYDVQLWSFDVGRSVDIEGDRPLTPRVCRLRLPCLWHVLMLCSQASTVANRSFEMLLGATEYRAPVDVWAYGLLLGELLRSEPLFLDGVDSEIGMIFSLFQYARSLFSLSDFAGVCAGCWVRRPVGRSLRRHASCPTGSTMLRCGRPTMTNFTRRPAAVRKLLI